jgi:hypothetical protein
MAQPSRNVKLTITITHMRKILQKGKTTETAKQSVVAKGGGR